MTATVSPSLLDGFNGARDASILSASDHDGGICHVQSTARSRDLLHRAGFARTRTHAFYKVPVITDQYNRLQIAP